MGSTEDVLLTGTDMLLIKSVTMNQTQTQFVRIRTLLNATERNETNSYLSYQGSSWSNKMINYPLSYLPEVLERCLSL